MTGQTEVDIKQAATQQAQTDAAQANTSLAEEVETAGGAVEVPEDPDAELVAVSLDDLDLDLSQVPDIEGAVVNAAEDSFNLKGGKYIFQILQAPADTAKGVPGEKSDGTPYLKRFMSGAFVVKVVASVDDKKTMDRQFRQTTYLVSKKGKDISGNGTRMKNLAMKVLPVYYADKGVTPAMVPSVIAQNKWSDFQLMYHALPSTEADPKFLMGDILVEDPDGDYPKNVLSIRNPKQAYEDGTAMLETIQRMEAAENA